MPEALPLTALRQDIDTEPQRLQNVLLNTRIRKELLGCAGNDAKKVVKAFTEQNAESALKTKPKVRLEACCFLCHWAKQVKNNET